VDLLDDLWLREAKQVGQVLEVGGMVAEALASVVGLDQPLPMDHRPHRPVNDDDAATQDVG